MVNFVQKLLADRALTKRKNQWTLRIIATELPYWPPIKILTYLLLAFHIPVYAVQMVYLSKFIRERQYINIIKFGPQLSVTLFAIVSVFCVIGVENATKTFLKLIQKPHTQIDSSIEDEIESSSKNVLNVLYLMGGSMVLPLLAASPFFFDVSDYLLFYKICEDFWPVRHNVQVFFKFMYWFTFPMAGYLLINPALILYYVVFRFKAQCMMVCKDFEGIGKGYRGVDHVLLRNSRDYQQVMYERLRQLIRDTTYIKRNANKCLSRIQPVIMGIFCIGPFIEISTIILIMNDIETSGGVKWPNLLVAVGAICGIALFWQVCQLIIDESSVFLDYATKCPWHMWDSKNRKALLLYMMNNEKPITISVAGLFTVNYPMCIQYVRATYSFSVLFFKLRN